VQLRWVRAPVRVQAAVLVLALEQRRAGIGSSSRWWLFRDFSNRVTRITAYLILTQPAVELQAVSPDQLVPPPGTC
jgi:hypothetical protein